MSFQVYYLNSTPQKYYILHVLASFSRVFSRLKAFLTIAHSLFTRA